MLCFMVEVGQTESDSFLFQKKKKGRRDIIVDKGVLVSDEMIHYLLLLDRKACKACLNG